MFWVKFGEFVAAANVLLIPVGSISVAAGPLKKTLSWAVTFPAEPKDRMVMRGTALMVVLLRSAVPAWARTVLLLSTCRVNGVAGLVTLPVPLLGMLKTRLAGVRLPMPSETLAALAPTAWLTRSVEPFTTVTVLPFRALATDALTVAAPLVPMFTAPAAPVVGPKALAALALIVPPLTVVEPV